MTSSWGPPLHAIGFGEKAADHAARQFAAVERTFAKRIGDPAAARAWWVPGRIEVLGKHTDYGGGRSLLASVERGFHVLATPRTDGVVRIMDASRQTTLRLALHPDLPPRPGTWANYPISVIRRVARDFPAAQRGMDAVLISSVPSAAGLSSSSALVIASFLPLALFNDLEATPEWTTALPNRDALAGYLGAMENGKVFGTFAADQGVGTHGGSQDHTAILRCRAGRLAQYRFLPVAPEADLAMPAGWSFAIGVSGVHAAKGGAVQAHYNALARQHALLLATWNALADGEAVSLLDVLNSATEAKQQLIEAVRRHHPDEADVLIARLGQFAEECLEIIPRVADAFRTGAIESIGDAVARSQQLAEEVLGNQVPETIHLAESARALGAAAASAFGAGFGGSVWALIPDDRRERFLAAWRARYIHAFPGRAARAAFFTSRPGPSACEIARG